MSVAIQNVEIPVKQEKVKKERKKRDWSGVKSFSSKIIQSIVTWSWCKRLLYWIVMSAGTASELVFLVSAIWVSVNANVHPFVLTFLSQKEADYLTYLATTGFVALPECIVGLAMITTIGHIKMYKRGGIISFLWSALFGIPTLVFLILSLVTIGCSVANVTFIMPQGFVVLRALAAFVFAFSAFLYEFLGKPQERERLAEKDALIAEWQNETSRFFDAMQKEGARLYQEWQEEKARLIADWQNDNARLNAELQNHKELLSESKKQQTMLLNAVNKSSDAALQGYSQECIGWLKSGVKSVSVDDIIRFTGHSNRKVQRAIVDGLLQPAPRNKELILVSSLLEWLKKTPAKTIDTEPELYVVNG